MRKLILIALFSCVAVVTSYAQADTISVEQADKFIGKDVVLKGTLKGFKEFTDKKGNLIMFLDIDDTYPNTLIGVTIFPNAFADIKLTKSDIGKNVYISGTMETYREKASLPIHEASQFKIVN